MYSTAELHCHIRDLAPIVSCKGWEAQDEGSVIYQGLSHYAIPREKGSHSLTVNPLL